jgi:hypothetical protein
VQRLVTMLPSGRPAEWSLMLTATRPCPRVPPSSVCLQIHIHLIDFFLLSRTPDWAPAPDIVPDGSGAFSYEQLAPKDVICECVPPGGSREPFAVLPGLLAD